MKKICLVGMVLFLVLVSTAAIGQSNGELCLDLQSSNPAVTTASNYILSYTGVSNGHVLFYGETCYTVPPNPPIPEVRDCLPVSGSGILNEGKLELSVQGAEHNHEFGFGTFTTGVFHVLLSLDTFEGTFGSESVTYYEIEGEEPIQVEFFDEGTAKAVKCPAVSPSELAADKQFKKMIKQLDAL